MALGDDRLVTAGPPELGDLNTPAGGGATGRLAVVSAADGSTVGTLKLDAQPVFDGIAACDGGLYLTTEAGQVICFSGR
jgi:hypothetical protein